MSDLQAYPTLVKTKLYQPPFRPDRMPRQRLLVRLDEALAQRVLLLSAPAGFGKTTLLSEWIKEHEQSEILSPQFCWLSLDEADNDPARF